MIVFNLTFPFEIRVETSKNNDKMIGKLIHMLRCEEIYTFDDSFNI